MISQSITQEELSKQIASQQGMTAASVISHSIEPVLLSCQASKFDKKIDIAGALLARDYKGLGNQAGNAIIERKEE